MIFIRISSFTDSMPPMSAKVSFGRSMSAAPTADLVLVVALRRPALPATVTFSGSALARRAGARGRASSFSSDGSRQRGIEREGPS